MHIKERDSYSHSPPTGVKLVGGVSSYCKQDATEEGSGVDSDFPAVENVKIFGYILISQPNLLFTMIIVPCTNY